jgi:hypothetical protein
MPCQALYTIVRLKVPDAIGSGGCTVDDVVRRIGQMGGTVDDNFPSTLSVMTSRVPPSDLYLVP